MRSMSPPRSRATAAILLGLLAFLGAAPGAPAAGKSVSDLGPPRPDAGRLWTVVMYFCADNNLEPYLLEDINTVEQAIPDKGVEVIVLVDRSKGFTKIDGDWTGARVYRIRPDKTKDQIKSELLADCGEVNMGDAKTLGGFVGAALKAFPAKHHAIFLSDHGAGWPDNCNDDDAPGAKDDYDELSLPETKAGLAEGLKAAGVDKFGIIGFDMCLMGQLEVAVACQGLGEIMIACESLGPGWGFTYEDFVADFATEADAGKLAKKVVDSFGKSCDAHRDATRTLSALDLSKVPAVVDALNAVAAKLIGPADEQWAVLSRSVFFAQTYNGRTDYRSGQHAKACFDLVDVLQRFRANCKTFPAAAEYDAALAAVKACVLAAYAGRDRRLSHGISIYAPVRGANLRPQYAAQAATKDWAWLKFLQRLHALQNAHAEKPTVTGGQVFGPDGKPAKGIIPLTGGVCTFELSGTNILWLTLDFSYRRADGSYGVMFKTFHVAPGLGRRKEDTAADLIDLLVPVYPDGKTKLAQELGGIQFGVAAGSKIIPATVEQTDPEDPTVAIVRGGVVDGVAKGKDLPIEILFNTNDWRVSSVTAHFPRPGGGYSTSSVTLKPTMKVKLLMETETRDGKIRGVVTGTFTWGAGPELVMTAAPAGQHVLFIKAEAIGGASSYGTIPYLVQENQLLANYLKSADKLTATSVLGSWVLQDLAVDAKTGKGRFEAAGVTVELKPNPKDARSMLYSALIEGEKIEGLARFDGRGVPMLNFFGKADDGTWVRIKAYVAVSLKSNGCTTVILKNIGIDEGSADIQRMVRPDEVAKVANEFDGKVTPPVDDIAKKLIGTWKNADGVLLKIAANEFVMYVNGELDSKGTYAIKGAKLLVTSSGETETVSFTLAGDTLTIVDEDGTKTVVQRAK